MRLTYGPSKVMHYVYSSLPMYMPFLTLELSPFFVGQFKVAVVVRTHYNKRMKITR